MANLRLGFRPWKGGPWFSFPVLGRGRTYLSFPMRRHRKW